ncbi:hypothetical protein GCK32_013438 [Trichostrongylus colubriformis]|uniref:Uncharacterized protein n=1 Tax=Trichostrongylus colubriformis TaxID=6319 RepID=A0AAN8FAP6_TRICO
MWPHIDRCLSAAGYILTITMPLFINFSNLCVRKSGTHKSGYPAKPTGKNAASKSSSTTPSTATHSTPSSMPKTSSSTSQSCAMGATVLKSRASESKTQVLSKTSSKSNQRLPLSARREQLKKDIKKRSTDQNVSLGARSMGELFEKMGPVR